jgi:hypothetical protein
MKISKMMKDAPKGIENSQEEETAKDQEEVSN